MVLLSMLWLATVWDAWKARHEKLKMNSNSTKDRFTPPRLGQGHEPWASLKSTFFKPALFSKENEHHYLPWLKFIHNHSWLSWQPQRFCIISSQQKGPRFLIYSKVWLFSVLLWDSYNNPGEKYRNNCNRSSWKKCGKSWRFLLVTGFRMVWNGWKWNLVFPECINEC